MNIDPNVLASGVVTLIASSVGSVVAILISRQQNDSSYHKDRVKELTHDLIRASNQVAAYHALEGEYAKELAQRQDAAEKTVKTEFRNRVEALGYERPHWTLLDARRTIESATGLNPDGE